MSVRRKNRKYREPTREETGKIKSGGFRLNELFFEEEIEDFVAAARRRVIGEFFFATERNPRYKQGSDRRPTQRTDNYILGVSGKLSDLALYVRNKMHQPFITVGQLPHKLAELPPADVEKIIRQAQKDVLLLVLQVMRHREVWYDEGTGVWQICQSSMDEWLDYRRAVRTMVKVDDRNYHGRNRGQSRRRGIAEGVSVSFA